MQNLDFQKCIIMPGFCKLVTYALGSEMEMATKFYAPQNTLKLKNKLILQYLKPGATNIIHCIIIIYSIIKYIRT